jgi:hypothetical protein
VERVEGDVRAALAFEGIEPISDPYAELGRLTSEVVAFRGGLSRRVAALERIRYSAPGAGSEQLRAELGLLERAQDRGGRLLSLLISADFEERRTRLSERQGRLAGEAIKQILDRMLEKVVGVLDDEDDRAQLREQWQRWVGEVVPGILRSMRDVPPPPAPIAGRVVP